MPDFYRDMCLLHLTLPQRRLMVFLYEHAGLGTLDVGEQIGGQAIDNAMMTRVFVSKIRKKLQGSGWMISHNTGGTAGYTVMRDDRTV